MKFERARTVIKSLLIAGIVVCVAALLTHSINPTIGAYLTLLGIFCVVGSLVFVFGFMKCPYCGKQIFLNCLTVKVCPHCRRHLVSGIKVKNKKIK